MRRCQSTRHSVRSLVLAAAGWPVLVAWTAIATAGCSAFWPRVIDQSPEDPAFHSSFVAGGSSTDGALCSLATVGPDVLRVVSPPEPTTGAIPLTQACNQEIPNNPPQHGRVGQLVAVETGSGPVYGYLYTTPSPAALVVSFTGMGMPAGGWVNERFAEVSARKSFITFAPVRDETARPIFFDPVREATHALDAIREIRQSCALSASLPIGFVGISLGGLEALLANREALRQGWASRVAALDPVLDIRLVTDNLDSFWHSFAVDAMQGFFRRILSGRYGEWPTPSFREVMERTRSHSEAMTNIDRDVPSAWLCDAKHDAFNVFVSEEDPVLGEKQRDFARACGFPLRPARAPGHTPLACRLELFDEMIDALLPQDSPKQAVNR